MPKKLESTPKVRRVAHVGEWKPATYCKDCEWKGDHLEMIIICPNCGKQSREVEVHTARRRITYQKDLWSYILLLPAPAVREYKHEMEKTE